MPKYISLCTATAKQLWDMGTIRVILDDYAYISFHSAIPFGNGSSLPQLRDDPIPLHPIAHYDALIVEKGASPKSQN
jgi:hypothetical protein